MPVRGVSSGSQSVSCSGSREARPTSRYHGARVPGPADRPGVPAPSWSRPRLLQRTSRHRSEFGIGPFGGSPHIVAQCPRVRWTAFRRPGSTGSGMPVPCRADSGWGLPHGVGVPSPSAGDSRWKRPAVLFPGPESPRRFQVHPACHGLMAPRAPFPAQRQCRDGNGVRRPRRVPPGGTFSRTQELSSHPQGKCCASGGAANDHSAA
jgi:hypothetical protein